MAVPARSKARSKSLWIDLAMRGGGAHGAFTWGVLDRIIEEPGLQIGGVSGTSAGAIVALAAVIVLGSSFGSFQAAARVR